MRKTMLFASLAVLLPAAAIAAPGDHPGKMAGLFTPEQRAMYTMGFKDQVKDMTPDQRKSFRHDQVAKLMAMSDDQRARMKSDLQAQWDALPQARKDRLEQRIAMRTQDGPQNGQMPPAGQNTQRNPYGRNPQGQDNTPIGFPRQPQ